MLFVASRGIARGREAKMLPAPILVCTEKRNALEGMPWLC